RQGAGDGGHERIPAAARRLVLDHVGGAAFAQRAAADLRPGLSHLLARPEARRADDAAHAAAGLWPRAQARGAAEPAPHRRAVLAEEGATGVEGKDRAGGAAHL